MMYISGLQKIVIWFKIARYGGGGRCDGGGGGGGGGGQKQRGTQKWWYLELYFHIK